MASAARKSSIDQLVRGAIAPSAAKAANEIARYIAMMAADELEARLARKAKSPAMNRVSSHRRSSRPAGEISKWVADSRARRVPNFVKEMTGGLAGC